MPGVRSARAPTCVAEDERAVKLGVPALALFPVVDQPFKTELAEEAWNPEGLVPRVVRAR